MRTNSLKTWLFGSLMIIMLNGFNPAPEQLATGEDLYREHCKSCHQRNGKGFFKMYPPLTDPAWVANNEKIVGNLVNGLRGKIMVNGKNFDGEMPAFRYLSDEEMASLINYIRSEIAGEGTAISASEVSRLRSELEVDSLKILTK
ncbi:MAG: c-type cytochrome [Owenweeksia sp.]